MKIVLFLFFLFVGLFCETFMLQYRGEGKNGIQYVSFDIHPEEMHEWVASYLADGTTGLPATADDWRTYCKYVRQNEAKNDSEELLSWSDAVDEQAYHIIVRKCFPEVEDVTVISFSREELSSNIITISNGDIVIEQNTTELSPCHC